jgi:hypothetical protein
MACYLRTSLAVIASMATIVQPVLAQKAVQPIGNQTVAAKEITPPAGPGSVAIPSSVVLKDARVSQIIGSLKVKRTISGASLRSNQKLEIGATRVDMGPLLANPAALPNVANRLRAKPTLVAVLADEITAYEVEQGLIIHTFLSYVPKPGACGSASGRTQLASAGANCAKKVDPAGRTAAFSDSQNARYIANPAARAKAVKAAEAEVAQARGGINADIAILRGKLSSAEGKAEIAAEVGAAETARLTKLSDAQLEEEAVNTAITSIDEIMFIPNADQLDGRRPTLNKLKDIKSNTPPVRSTRDLENRIFITGFTLGKNYEWGRRIEKTISWCVVGCKKTYFVGASAQLGYGAGLRFPVQLGGTYDYLEKGGSRSAKLTPSFEPVNGSEADYAAAGLPSDKLFEGKELVAQFSFAAQFGYKLPGSSAGINEKWNRDFTKYLPGDLYDGQFDPPAPGEKRESIKVFNDDKAFDLLGSQANFYVVGAQLFPAVKIGLTSGELSFDMLDKVSGKETKLSKSGEPVSLGINADRSSQWTIGNPRYNLAFELTPGLNPRLFLDLAVWSTEWNDQVWFPQIAVTLPPGGVNFGCHAGTVCARDYKFSPSGQQEGENDDSPLGMQIDKWGIDFTKNWEPKCADKKCKTGIAFLRTGAVGKANTLEQIGVDPKIKDPIINNKKVKATFADMAPIFEQANIEAAGIVNEARARKIEKDASGYALLAEASWSPKCADDLCRANIKKLSQEYKAAWVKRLTENPDAKFLGLTIGINKEFNPRYQKEIDDSIARVRGGSVRQPEPPPTREKL